MWSVFITLFNSGAHAITNYCACKPLVMTDITTINLCFVFFSFHFRSLIPRCQSLLQVNQLSEHGGNVQFNIIFAGLTLQK